ncbi:MAG TPA: DNA polymerase III subunit gamma/tau [Candidatus Pelagibacter bacterium]|jgi:DNA polymerase-3 subunit gamma/tau|nr:DNA polymerase III subunit gamma/tau [Candidatus Pelagibacter bacterium]
MTNNSTVLALKYRPVNFDQLIGQELIGETIYNSIKLNKVPNAYLLTGIRGTGKTSIARIIAKVLNCKNGFENLCKDNFCENCEAITNSNHIDIFELDAASQSSVENTRELIEFSRYAPTSSKYKIYILDECHMLSKQAWASLLKTLEEPPEYLKFIFATTEIRKVPITIVSRCQRFDLSRIKSDQLFQFIKKITEKEKGRVTDEALKLIVKLSEGSVRDALSLLDRGLLSNSQGEELDLIKAQKIYGYFDKSSLIELFQNLFKGDENKVINIYRKIYEAGVEPKIFLNDFLEILYFIKNISSIKLDGTNFSLNDDEFNAIDKISRTINPKDIILFWQFTIDTIDELDIVANPNLCVEMFLVRLMYLKDFKDSVITKDKLDNTNNEKKTSASNKIVDQIKNIAQQDEIKPKIKSQETTSKLFINNFEELIELCIKKKEIKLKYELESNVNLVTFVEGRIEIAFNENLDKDFIKELSNKLYEWTNTRWIISLSKKKGLISKKQEEKTNKDKIFDNVKKNKIYNTVLEILPDAELVEFKKNEHKDD